jgi:phage terminase large subunit-like protein
MNLSDMFQFLGTGLRKQAAEPNILGYVPHSKQDAFHQAPERGRLYLGGNRSGKTTAGIIEDLWWVTRRHPYRQIPSEVAIRGRVIGDGFETGNVDQVLIPDIKRWILPSDLINGSWENSYSKSEHKLTLENDSFIEFKSFQQDQQSHAGTSRHFIHFDEEPPQDIYIENMLRLVDTAGLWWITLTPVNGMTWIYDELVDPFNRGALKNITVVEVATTDNPFIDPTVLEEMLQTGDAAERESRLYGRFTEKGGMIFPEFNKAHLITNAKGWRPPPGWRVYMSLDHGLNNPTAILWHAVSPDNYTITFKEHYAANMIVKDHAAVIQQIERDYNLEVWARPADPATSQRSGITGTSIIEAYATEGIYLSTQTIPRDVKTGIDKMRMYMRPSAEGPPHWQIIEEECPNLIREMKRLHWKTFRSGKSNSGNNKLEEVHKKDDHAFDSCRYFFTMLSDLSPDTLWHAGNDPAVGSLRLPDTYLNTMVKIANNQQVKRNPLEADIWKTRSYGFADEYASSLVIGWEDD